ncbi:MAG: hypothetical protein IKD21_05025 [Clostridia bacterium]|nr:hypothetical protein [Clostridia bacterium]
MAKRIFSMILASMLLIGTLTVVSATNVNEYEDDFDGEGTEAGVLTNWAYDTANYASDVWNMTTKQITTMTANWSGGYGTAADPYIQVEIAEDEDDANNQVMNLKYLKANTCTGVATKAKVKFATNTAADTVLTTFDFMVPDDGTSGKFNIVARAGASYSFVKLIEVNNSQMTETTIDTTGAPSTAAADTFTFTRGAWYTAALKVQKQYIQIKIYDANGVQRLTRSTTTYGMDYSQLGLVFPSQSTTGYNVNIDNSKIVTVLSTNDTVDYVSDSMTSKTDVATSTNSVDVTFDQPVAVPAEGVVTLNPASGTAISCTATAAGPNALRISWTDALVMNTQYTLDCSGVEGWAGNVANAALATAVTFTTSGYNPLTLDYKDGFEDATGTYKLANGGYSNNTWVMTSAVSYNPLANVPDDTYFDMTVVQDTTDNKAMQITQKKINFALGTKNASLSTYDRVNFSFKFKLPESNGNAAGGWNFSLGYGAGTAHHLVRVSPQGDVYNMDANGAPITNSRKSIDLDEWHTVFMEATATGARVYIYDAEGNEVFEEPNYSYRAGTTFTNVRFYILVPALTKVETNSILLDDGRVFAYKAENNLTYEGEATVANVNPFKGYVDLKFDLPVNVPSSSSVQLTSAADTNVGATRITLTKASYDTLRVSFDALDESTEYTLSFAGVTGRLSNALYSTGTQAITFTTAAAEGVKGTNCNTVIGADGAVGDSVNVIIGNYEATDVDAKVLVALYSSDTTLAGVEPVDPWIMPGQNNITLPLSKTYTGITKIKVIMLDNMTNLKPIMECIEIQ